MALKAALFNINDVFPVGQRFAEPSLGLGYIKSYYEKYSLVPESVSINILKNEIGAELKRLRPDIIGISSVTQDYSNAVTYAKQLKAGGCRALILIGGIHISSLPESLDPVFDAAVIGEGEETCREFFEAVAQSGPGREGWAQIKGLVFYDGDKIIYTQKRPLIENLDSLPHPFRSPGTCRGFTSMLTSRGCPFRCSFCSSSSFWGNKIRYNSAAYVVEEMRELVKRCGVRHISIWDDLFAININRISEIAHLINKERALFRAVSFGITAKASLIEEELCGLLRQINVTRVAVGLESGSERILKVIKGKEASLEGSRNAVRLLKKYGFNVTAGFILGLPGETKADMQATYQFIKSLPLDGGGSSLAVPYPKTSLWDYAIKMKLADIKMDFSKMRLVNNFSLPPSAYNFILLAQGVPTEEIWRIAGKIQRFFTFRNFISLFNRQTLTLRNIFLVLRYPRIFLPFVAHILKRLMNTPAACWRKGRFVNKEWAS